MIYIVAYEDKDKDYFTLDIEASSEKEALEKAKAEVKGDPKSPRIVRITSKLEKKN